MKILIVRNNLQGNYQAVIDKSVSFLQEKTPLKYDVSYLNTSLVPEFKSWGTYWGTTGTKEKLVKQIPENVYDAVVFMYETAFVDHPLAAWTYFQGLYPQTEFVEIPINCFNEPERFPALAHEMVHVHCRILEHKGIYGLDVMDTYIDQNNPYSPTGNFAMTFKNLAPYWYVFDDKVEVTLTRLSDNGVQTTGQLVAKKGGKTFTCKTLELPWKNNQRNISCIPKGEYKAYQTLWMKHVRFTYALQNVPNRSGVRIHSANYNTDLLGCIALGSQFTDINHDGQVDVINSRKTIADFETFLGKLPFTLTIK